MCLSLFPWLWKKNSHPHHTDCTRPLERLHFFWMHSLCGWTWSVFLPALRRQEEAKWPIFHRAYAIPCWLKGSPAFCCLPFPNALMWGFTSTRLCCREVFVSVKYFVIYACLRWLFISKRLCCKIWHFFKNESLFIAWLTPGYFVNLKWDCEWVRGFLRVSPALYN